jgi:hypothetical protein
LKSKEKKKNKNQKSKTEKPQKSSDLFSHPDAFRKAVPLITQHEAE